MPEKAEIVGEFKSGEHVYILSPTGVLGIEWFEATVLNYSPPLDRYTVDLVNNSAGEKVPRCMTFIYGGNIFRTRGELFEACEEYCRRRERFWEEQARSFSSLSLKELKEKEEEKVDGK